MDTVKDKDKVGLFYIGKLDNGEIFKEIKKDSPLYATIGESELPPSLEIAITGMKVGDSNSVRVPPDESYGLREKDLLQELELSNFPETVIPKPGMTLALNVKKEGKDHQVPATVIKVADDIVTIDYNHPLAGHHLTYEVTILSIENS